jgi:hypothetical protein
MSVSTFIAGGSAPVQHAGGAGAASRPSALLRPGRRAFMVAMTG